MPRLLLITDDRGDLLPRVAAALAGGVKHVLLRAKGQSAAAVTATAQALLPLVQEAGGRLLIHDRVDVALTLSAHGVHLPANGLATGAARRLLGPTPLLGRSCHSAIEISEALAQGADYVTLSPLFATASHPGAACLGLQGFSRCRRAVTGPVLALGGIDASNAQAAMQAGADGVALISGILGQADPRAAAAEIIRSLR